MKTIIPLTQPPNSAEWAKLAEILADPNAAAQATVIFNPACGPGPDKPWTDRKHWLGLMAKFSKLGARLALYLPVQNAEPFGHKWTLSRRSVQEISDDVRIWRERYLDHLSVRQFVWWADFHPVGFESLSQPEILALYFATQTEAVIANVRTVPTPEFARACPAAALCVHAGNGWPPMTEPTLGGKPTAIIACNAPGLVPGAKRNATWLYATPAAANCNTHNAVSPHLARILSLAV